MERRYSFFVIFFAILAPLAWWSERAELSSAQTLPSPQELTTSDMQHRELIEALDHLVAYEYYYRSVYGHFTKLVSRLGYSIPQELQEAYDIRVTEASRDRLTISALSEVNGRTQDLVSIDQDYEVTASFRLPEPRAEYLKGVALKHLRALKNSTAAQVDEQGVFKGYFKFEERVVSQDRKDVVAIGVKAPVLGLKIDSESPGVDEQGTQSLSVQPAALSLPSMSTLEEAFLAQRIFRAEVGRYAKNWSELSKIASFKFEDKAQFGQNGQVPFGDAGSILEIDADREKFRVPSSAPEPLEIEAIAPGDQNAR